MIFSIRLLLLCFRVNLKALNQSWSLAVIDFVATVRIVSHLFFFVYLYLCLFSTSSQMRFIYVISSFVRSLDGIAAKVVCILYVLYFGKSSVINLWLRFNKKKEEREREQMKNSNEKLHKYKHAHAQLI